MTILGLSELFNDQTNKMTVEEMMEAARAIHLSAKKYFELLENLLEWSRDQYGLNVAECEDILLVPFVHDFLKLNMEATAKKEIGITCSIPEGLTVYTNRHILHTVFRNLVSNAVKFTHNGGEITISAKENNGHPAEISIRDTGIGMNSDQADNLFKPMAKTSRKGTLGEETIGLGLIICKFFIEKQGGSLRIESAPGKGSAFHFTMGK
jgi:signal transduction histidine kinase